MIAIPINELAPEIDRCPACGMLFCDRHPVYNTFERRNVNVRAVAIHHQNTGCALVACVLQWECNACGCVWLHGQFAEVAK